MSILFDDAASEYIEVDSAPVTAAAFSWACWFYSDDAATLQTLMYLGDKDSPAHRWALFLRGDEAGDQLWHYAEDGGGSAQAETSTGYSTNTWHHACGVEAGSADRRVFIDGGSKGTDTTSVSPANADRISIGRSGDSTPGVHMSGRVAEAAVWNAALSDAEVALLGKGFSPLQLRPDKLVYYLPGVRLGQGGTQYDRIGGLAMTETNTPTAADHPPQIFLPEGVIA